MLRDPFFHFRAIVGAMAIVLGILALWVIAGEIMRPRLIYFPTDRNEAEALYAARGSAARAAEVGLVRGDLWTAAAIAGAAPLLFGATGNSPEQSSQAVVENMRATAGRAAGRSPHDSRLWLVLAGLDLRLGSHNPKIAETLKLSYYTGPNELSLMPLRLLLAVQSDAISDEEMQSLVAMDIRRILQRPDLRPAIARAYEKATPEGREVIETTLAQVDPSFLAKIAAPSRSR